MSQTLPLFPLGMVLFPGVPLPLHIFEDRYRQLIRELMDSPEPRQFGVVAIRKGRETGIDGVSSLHEIGCTAVLRQVAEHPDGRYDVVTLGAERFRLDGLDEAGSYLRGVVEMLPDEAGNEAAAGLAVPQVQRALRDYIQALATRQGSGGLSIPDLPADPVRLSWLVAASVLVDVPQKQALLAEPDAAERLAAERSLLVRETTMLRSLTSAPATDLRYTPYSSN